MIHFIWRQHKAFSLVEVLVVILIVAIMSIIAFVNFWSQSPLARNAMRSDTSSKVRIAYLQSFTDERFNQSSSTCAGVWATPVTYSWSNLAGCNIVLDWSSTWTAFLKDIGVSWTVSDPLANSWNSDYSYEFTYILGSPTHEFSYVSESTDTTSYNYLPSVFAHTLKEGDTIVLEGNNTTWTPITPIIPIAANWDLMTFTSWSATWNTRSGYVLDLSNSSDRNSLAYYVTSNAKINPSTNYSCRKKPSSVVTNNTTFTEGTPTSKNQSWIKDWSGACYYTCKATYSGNNCEISAPTPVSIWGGWNGVYVYYSNKTLKNFAGNLASSTTVNTNVDALNWNLYKIWTSLYINGTLYWSFSDLGSYWWAEQRPWSGHYPIVATNAAGAMLNNDWSLVTGTNIPTNVKQVISSTDLNHIIVLQNDGTVRFWTKQNGTILFHDNGFYPYWQDQSLTKVWSGYNFKSISANGNFQNFCGITTSNDIYCSFNLRDDSSWNNTGNWLAVKMNTGGETVSKIVVDDWLYCYLTTANVLKCKTPSAPNWSSYWWMSMNGDTNLTKNNVKDVSTWWMGAYIFVLTTDNHLMKYPVWDPTNPISVSIN